MKKPGKITDIPIVTLDEVKKFGVQVVRYDTVDESHFVKSPHRDKDYLFVFVNEGHLELLVDFKRIFIPRKSVYFILPGQIHQHIGSSVDVFVVAVDSPLVKNTFKSVLQDSCFTQTPTEVDEPKARHLETCAALLLEIVKTLEGTKHRQIIKQGIIDAIIGQISEEYAHKGALGDAKDSRNVSITKDFRTLLFRKYKKIKKPSAYADALNISTAYLNEAVKATSGFTVSYWIQYMIIGEAKRLLFYTDKSVKQIASELGFDDYNYFSRMFSKNENMSPNEFRKKYL
ncbi:helix-turn-helix domain-containing protein [Flavobacterium sp.]|uniref:helix-turn-helix domain-containing protein n=1 Tax=Flavobacterium sp. TaxID=239 RepID=UPI0039E530B0